MTSEKKQLLFSVTASDCDWSYTKGTGAGGQKRNKTSSAVHCNHRPSGAHGYAEDSRKQLENKRLAFQRMYETKLFQDWLRLETARHTGELAAIDEYVKQEIRKVRVEVREDGRWVEVDKDAQLQND